MTTNNYNFGYAIGLLMWGIWQTLSFDASDMFLGTFILFTSFMCLKFEEIKGDEA